MAKDSGKPSLSKKSGRFPRWGVNAMIYAALGLASLEVLQFFGPFGQPMGRNGSDNGVGAIEVRVDGLRGAPVPSVYLNVPKDANDSEDVAELRIMFATAAASTDTFSYDHLAIARRPITPEQPFYDESPVECDAKQYRRGEGEQWVAASMDRETIPSAQNWLPFRHPLAERDNTGSVTQFAGQGAYVYLSVECPITGIDFTAETRTTKSVMIPDVVVRTANSTSDLAASVYLSRNASDLITNSTRPPDQTTLNSYIWNADTARIGTDPMMVSITNPEIQTSSDKAMFMWGLFAGIAGAFFFAMLQEVISGERGRRQNTKGETAQL